MFRPIGQHRPSVDLKLMDNKTHADIRDTSAHMQSLGVILDSILLSGKYPFNSNFYQAVCMLQIKLFLLSHPFIQYS